MRRWVVLVGIVLAMVVVLGRMAWNAHRGIEVSVATLSRGRVVTAVYATGRVDSDQRATLRARLAAPLAALLVGEGQAVKAGEVVARQEDAAVRIAVDRASRELEASRATLAQAQDAATRSEKLVAESLLAEDAWVRAREGAREAAAQVAAKQAALDLAREQESWSVLRSPMDGVVTALLRRTGDPLREGDEVLTIVDLSRAYIRVAVDERDAGHIAVGQSVRMVFDAYAGETLRGEVWRLVPAVDRLTKSTDVLVTMPAKRPPLQLDFTVTVNIVTGVVEDALVAPRDALDGAGSTRGAFVVDAAGRARRRVIAIGACDEGHCEVVSGAAAGETVVSPLPAGLNDGERVRVTHRPEGPAG